MPLHPHENLQAWKESMAFVKHCYELTRTFPAEERYGLCSQIQRASVSVPSNFAEGAARMSRLETKHFYLIARASLMELDTLISISSDLGYLSEPANQTLRSRIETISKLINGLIRHQSNQAKLSQPRRD